MAASFGSVLYRRFSFGDPNKPRRLVRKLLLPDCLMHQFRCGLCRLSGGKTQKAILFLQTLGRHSHGRSSEVDQYIPTNITKSTSYEGFRQGLYVPGNCRRVAAVCRVVNTANPTTHPTEAPVTICSKTHKYFMGFLSKSDFSIVLLGSAFRHPINLSGEQYAIYVADLW